MLFVPIRGKPFNILCGLRYNTRDVLCSKEVKTGRAMAKVAFIKETILPYSKLRFEMTKRHAKYNIWNVALYRAGTWNLIKRDRRI